MVEDSIAKEVITDLQLLAEANPSLAAPAFLETVKGISLPRAEEYQEGVELFSQIMDDMRYLRDVYGIRPRLHGMNGGDKEGLDAEKLDFREAVSAVRIFREEISKYPPLYIKKQGVTLFRILGDLKAANLESQEYSKIGGISYEPGEIYISSGEIEKFYRRNIHHELLHRTDYERYEFKDKMGMLGWLIDNKLDAQYETEWIALNAPGTASYTDNWRNYEQVPLGFARLYGLKNSKEDRATVAEMLFIDTKELFKRCEKDDVLKAKVEKLIEVYDKESEGKMDRAFFEKLAAGERIDWKETD